MEWIELDDKTVETLEALLASEPCSATGVVLRLAWRAGLLRDEIVALTWDQVGFEHMVLRLPDREVPMDEDLAHCLRQWQVRCEGYGPYIAVSLHKRTHMQPESVSNLSRAALNRVGLTQVRLGDLRYNYILRRSAQEGWQDALRTSGISIGFYRAKPGYRHAREAARAKEAASPSPQLDEQTVRERLEAVLEANRLSPVAVALRLSRETAARFDELCALTWDEVDLDGGAFRIGGRSLPLRRETVELLREFRAQRQPNDDPHLFLSPRSRTPYQADRLSVLMRELLVQGGLDNVLPKTLRREAVAAEQERRKQWIREHAAQSGRLTATDCAGQLGISPHTAKQLLEELCADGALMRDRAIYFPAGSGTVMQQREQTIRSYLAQHGPSVVPELSSQLGMSLPMIRRALVPMCARGEVAREYAVRDMRKVVLYALQTPDGNAGGAE